MYLIEHAMCGVFICCQKFGNSTRKSFNVLDSDFGKGPQSREATEQISVLCSLLRRLHIVLLNAELYFFYPILFVILWQGLKILHHYRQCFGYICVVKCRWINRVWDFIGAMRLGNVFKEPAFESSVSWWD